MKKDQNIIFLHIAKNGGTTFHSILERFYSHTNIYNIIDDPENDAQLFMDLPLQERKKYHLVKGHIFFGLHEYLVGNTTYITFLRKPEERIISYYYYLLTLKDHPLYKPMHESKMTLMDFAIQMKDNKDINNAQIKMISGINDTPQLMLEKAVENIENHFSFVGIHERYNESLIILKQLFRWGVPYYKKKNVNATKKPLTTVGEATLNIINELNHEDNLLYNNYMSKFDDYLNNVSFLDFELKRLQLYSKFYSSTKLKMLRSHLNFLKR